MNKEKQIGEITKILARDETCGDCVTCVGHGWCVDEISATELYNAGYRKASDVAEEIFAEIDKLYDVFDDYDEIFFSSLRKDLAKLKKKYTEDRK